MNPNCNTFIAKIYHLEFINLTLVTEFINGCAKNYLDNVIHKAVVFINAGELTCFGWMKTLRV